MKNLYLFLFGVSIANLANSQTPFEVKENNVTFHMNAEGAFINNDSRASFNVQGINNCFAVNVWLKANTPTGQLLSAETFEANEFKSGSRIEDYTDSLYIADCTRKVWFVTKKEIDQHQTSYQDSNYVLPENIARWPGNMCSSYFGAPYVDLNQNNLYDPEHGDYPSIPGDFATLTVRNDMHPEAHKNTNGAPMKTTIMQLTFGYIGLGSPFDETLFSRFIFVNEGSLVWNNPKFSLYHDFDIGNVNDDYYGSLPELHAVFTYNGDAVDDVSSGSSPGYGVNPPALALTFLNSDLSSSVYYNFGGTPNDSYYIMQMDGYNPDGSEPLNFPFVFPGLPSDPTSGAATNVGAYPGDKRGVATTQLENILPGGSATVDVAFVWSRDTVNPYPKSVDKVYTDVEIVRGFYNSTVGLNPVAAEQNTITIYPNPTNAILHFSDPVASWTVLSLDGKILLVGKTQSVDLTDISAGTYIIQINDLQGFPQVNRFVKQ